MFAKRHPWTLALATAIATAIFSALKPTFDRWSAEATVRVLLYLAPFAVIWSFFYLLVRGIEEEVGRQLDLTRREIRAVPPADFDIEDLNSVWLAPTTVDKVSEYRQDPIYGTISIDGTLLQLFRQPIVQRLGHIRQLSFSYLTFPTATHTRLAHSLGVCKIADLALSGILERNRLYSGDANDPQRMDLSAGRDELLLKCKVAALLHDLGHGPFGHALDKFVGYYDPAHPNHYPDKEYSIRYLRGCLSEKLTDLDIDPETIVALFDKTPGRSLRGFDVLIADLIDSPLDVDRIDYLFRDGIMTGLAAGYGSLHTLLEMMRPYASGDSIWLAFDEYAVPAIENLLYLRDFMYVNCYEIPTKLAAERAFERIADEAVSGGLLTLDQLMLLTDDTVLSTLLTLGRSNPCIKGLVQALLTGQRYEEVYSSRPPDSSNAEVQNWLHNKQLGDVGGGLRQAYIVIPRLWERRIAEEARIGVERDWQVLVSVPSHLAYVQKESRVGVLVPDGVGWKTVDLFKYSKKLGAILEQMRPASAYIRVFASAAATREERDRIRAAAALLLG